MKLTFRLKGGSGSGHHGHRGIPGHLGGSLPGKSGMSIYKKVNPNGRDTLEQYRNPDGTWTEERQKLHNEIKRYFFEGKTPVDNPVSYMLGGGPASGKTTLIRSGKVDIPDNTILASGDDIKILLPEYIYGDPNDPNRAAFVHEESSYLAKEIMEEASSQKYNVLMDGTGDGSIQSIKSKIDKLSKAGQSVHGLYVTVDIGTAVTRSIERAKVTGRYMPESVLRANHAAISAVFEDIVMYSGLANVKLYDTNGTEPKIIASGSNGVLTVLDDELYKKFLDKATQ